MLKRRRVGVVHFDVVVLRMELYKHYHLLCGHRDELLKMVDCPVGHDYGFKPKMLPVELRMLALITFLLGFPL